MKEYLIIGNGVAGNAAAESIRRLDPEGKISVFTREKHFFYYRPALPEYLAGEKQEKDITVHPAAWYERNGIDLYRETEIAEINRDFSDGQRTSPLVPFAPHRSAELTAEALILSLRGGRGRWG